MTLAVFFSLEAGKRGLFGTVAAAGFFKKISVQCTAEITYGCLDLCSAAKTPSAGQWRAVELDDGAPLLLRYKQR
jgi:hypothetical protein